MLIVWSVSERLEAMKVDSPTSGFSSPTFARAAVTAAVEAAEAIEETQGLMGKSAVIPAPHRDLLRFV